MQTPTIFERISQAVAKDGYCVIDNALPLNIALALHQHMTLIPSQNFKAMGVGRGGQLHTDKTYRNDTSLWLNNEHSSEKDYATWMEKLRLAINQQLFLGLMSYEAHFAHYAPQSFYKRHVDAFKGRSNRKLTTVYYLNPDWSDKDGGELLMYANELSTTPFQKVVPHMNRLVVFLSEDYPHEVSPAQKDRYSIAGWFKLKG
ncbi:MAG: 2OG-Fe(II) oxygenase [Ghiorsea sp.]|nr:2OG-Fe(II) oxygenase [Ghiorsea sp.]